MAVLVTAATRHGATLEIAEFIAARLRSRGLEVSLSAPKDVDDVLGFSTVVLGSAVYAGHWLPEARRFAESFALPLSARDVWVFSSGPIGDPSRPKEQPDGLIRPGGLPWARDHVIFSGRLSRSRLGPFERILTRFVRAQAGDYRDWDAVAAWTDRICDAEQHARRDDDYWPGGGPVAAPST